jgi:hypothetical protein
MDGVGSTGGGLLVLGATVKKLLTASASLYSPSYFRFLPSFIHE